MLRPPIDQQVTFLYTRDLANTAVFYEKTLALPLVLAQGACRIYRVSGGALGDFQASPRLALRAACVSLIAGLALALAFMLAGRLAPLACLLLALGAFGGWMYSLRPLALAWRGWGEATNAFLGGMLLMLYGYAVHSGGLEWRVVLISLPFSLFVFVNLLATTWADRDADLQVGKRTLATRWSVDRLRQLYFLVITAAYLLLTWQRGALLPDPVFWGSLLLAPLAVWAGLSYTRRHSPLPSVLVMVLLLLVQLAGWSGSLAG
jgi:1,4-dihydroxy-2-naphthoate polyprenyltransferase